jgi:hypothetical protein
MDAAPTECEELAAASSVDAVPDLETSSHPTIAVSPTQSQLSSVGKLPLSPFDEKHDWVKEAADGQPPMHRHPNCESRVSETEVDTESPLRLARESAIGIFCTLCYSEAASRTALRQHISEAHPNATDLSEDDLAAVRDTSALENGGVPSYPTSSSASRGTRRKKKKKPVPRRTLLCERRMPAVGRCFAHCWVD